MTQVNTPRVQAKGLFLLSDKPSTNRHLAGLPRPANFEDADSLFRPSTSGGDFRRGLPRRGQGGGFFFGGGMRGRRAGLRLLTCDGE